ncbi:hypothetical protein KUCAC02_019151 [Chaenocephalus aceratus]|uniref:Uncharacterized protein n=1 Tax=Chaenocephalus aceratus TaxID=36190 RepID=A0ACB9WAN9_CHAAC|nr:hypothetical protein KUCAC02_019151 [Chaenocephalus aceratus]
MARATLSGVIGPPLTEIHKSSLEFFLFFVSDLAVAMASLQQQLGMATAAAVAAHDQRGEEDDEGQSQQHHQAHRVLYAPWLCFSVAMLQSWWKKSRTLSVPPSMALGYGVVAPFN